MLNTTNRNVPPIITMISLLTFAEAVTFLLAALLHLGIPLGFSEPRIIPATIVEGLCGLFLAVSAYAIIARKPWAWGTALAAHLFATAGVLLGIIVLALAPDRSTEVNTISHRVILVSLVVVLALLITRSARAALGRRQQALSH